MANIVDYIIWRGDLTLDEREFNEVDNLVLSKLIYFDYEQVMPELGHNRNATLEEIFNRYLAAENLNLFEPDTAEVLAACASSERFKAVEVIDYARDVDDNRQIQFAAAVFRFPNGDTYIAFRGTDGTMVGWRDDFNFSFMEATPTQLEALRYLDRFLAGYVGSVIVGGHSKGGNLAVFASAFSSYRDRIDLVYSNDGPGFNRLVADTQEFRNVQPKIRHIIPEDSMVGIILQVTDKRKVIRSDDEGAGQHRLMSWMVERDHIIEVEEQSSASRMLDKTFDKWLGSLDYEERKQVFSTLFDMIDSVGIKTVSELNGNKLASYNAILRAATGQSREKKEVMFDTVKKFALAGKDVIWNEALKRFEPHK